MKTKKIYRLQTKNRFGYKDVNKTQDMNTLNV
jgi:hypothetical protein